MNRFLLGTILLFTAPVCAQDAPVPALQSAPQTLLTQEFVDSTVYIGAGTFALKTEGDQTLGTFDYKREADDYDRLFGADILRVYCFVVPDELKARAGEKLIVFARFDGKAKRASVVGFLPSTPANIARVKELAAKSSRLEWKFSSDKKSYEVGEPVKLTLEIKNVSKAPLSIYTGEYAVQFSLKYGGASHSKSDENARKRPNIVTLAPGESWKDERTYDDLFPVGTLGLEFFYDGSNALKSSRALPDDLFLAMKSDEFDVEIVPASASAQSKLKAQLKSPRWNEQLDAAQKILQSDNAADWKSLESFAAHPYEKLREVAGQAMLKSDTFTPALKTLLYGGTNLELSSFRGERLDLDLALLARAFVEDEAQKRGFVPVSVGYSPLARLKDPRVGDLIASRLKNGDPMQGGANNGAILLQLSGLREPYKSAREPLSPELQARVLEAWNTKRTEVKNLFTLAQLETEIALARKIAFNDFKVGAFDAPVVHFVDEGRKNNFSNAPQDALDKELNALPKEAAPDLMRVLSWRNVSRIPESALRFLARSGDKDAFVFLTKIAYNTSGDSDARFEATRLLGEMDFARAQTHLEAFLLDPVGTDWYHNARRQGAAIALAAHGEKRAVPVVFAPEYQKHLTFLHNDIGASLQQVTGQNFSNWTQWKKWWEREGSKQEWK